LLRQAAAQLIAAATFTDRDEKIMTQSSIQDNTILHFINGAQVDSASARYADVFNPALGVPVARVTLGTKHDVDVAVKAAAAAFPSWSATPPLTRARVLFKYLQLCQQHLDEFATLLTREHGKTFADAQGEVARGVLNAALRHDFFVSIGEGCRCN
jgi:malonate-semialdehyde dehydrogenase (acetylating)/methylmalonate-semialdehyde dehydrogenase